MTLKEAIESGRDYRRKGHGLWFPNLYNAGFSRDDVLADWEVRDPPVTITRKQLEEALKDTFLLHRPPFFAGEVAKRLGL